ncbi:zinc/cadmium resistance protein isoform X1 [Cyprinodon tularosa]|uniref:zinc/cadmium resistance protein isoform X1 n=2 Tax=Cyprinodon tularosa TaxID=77115 RepID=UPI0018E24732|nr:zinc/cadmium resistance protein isoform X1 [Cyprinodon tularosa]
MRLRHWCMLGVTALLLLCEIAASQLCKSLITMVDGFHTLFILMQMALLQTKGIIKPHIHSFDASPSSPHDSFTLEAFPHPSAELPPGALSDVEQPKQDPPSMVNPHKCFTPGAPNCSLSFPNSRIQVVCVFISSLVLVSLCVSYCLEIISFIVKPHPVQHPLIPVVVGAGSLLYKLLLIILDCDELQDKKAEICSRIRTEPHLHINHKEESRGLEEEELSGTSKVQVATHNCFHSEALVLCNPGTLNLPDHGCKTGLLEIGEGESSAAHSESEGPKHQPCMGHSDYENIPEASLVCQSSSGWSCLCLLSFIFVFQGLFTSLLALINSIVTVLIGPQLLHCSGACSILIYLDPCLSLLAGITLIVTSLPQVHRYGMLLLQASPPRIGVSNVGRRIASVPGVQAIHELHIWQLTESLTVASVHVHCNAGFPPNRCADLMSGVTKVLQSVGVSCCTVQPEFTSPSSPVRGDEASTFIHGKEPYSPPLPPCSLACGKACASSMCCSLQEEKEEESRSAQRQPAGGTNEEPQTMIIENTVL